MRLIICTILLLVAIFFLVPLALPRYYSEVRAVQINSTGQFTNQFVSPKGGLVNIFFQPKVACDQFKASGTFKFSANGKVESLTLDNSEFRKSYSLSVTNAFYIAHPPWSSIEKGEVKKGDLVHCSLNLTNASVLEFDIWFVYVRRLP